MPGVICSVHVPGPTNPLPNICGPCAAELYCVPQVLIRVACATNVLFPERNFVAQFCMLAINGVPADLVRTLVGLSVTYYQNTI